VQHLPEKAKLAAKQGRKTADLKSDSRVARRSDSAFFRQRRLSRTLRRQGGMLMKKFLGPPLFVFFCVLLFSSTGWCLTLGDLDEFIACDPKVGSLEAELNWINSKTPTDYSSAFKSSENVDVMYNGTGYYFEFEGTVPEYYLVKNQGYMALYKNLSNFQVAYFDPMECFKIGDDLQISHYTGVGQSVPEPSTVFLLGLGLVGLAGLGRKKIKS
jgi:hypothetical protein